MGLGDLIPDEDKKSSKKGKKFSPANKPSSSTNGSNKSIQPQRIPHDKHGERRACPNCAVVSAEKNSEDKWVCDNENCDYDVFLSTWGEMHIQDGFLYGIDMVEVNDELRDIISYIR